MGTGESGQSLSAEDQSCEVASPWIALLAALALGLVSQYSARIAPALFGWTGRGATAVQAILGILPPTWAALAWFGLIWGILAGLHSLRTFREATYAGIAGVFAGLLSPVICLPVFILFGSKGIRFPVSPFWTCLGLALGLLDRRSGHRLSPRYRDRFTVYLILCASYLTWIVFSHGSDSPRPDVTNIAWPSIPWEQKDFSARSIEAVLLGFPLPRIIEWIINECRSNSPETRDSRGVPPAAQTPPSNAGCLGFALLLSGLILYAFGLGPKSVGQPLRGWSVALGILLALGGLIPALVARLGQSSKHVTS